MQEHKDLLTAYKTQLPALLPSFKSVVILPSSAFELVVSLAGNMPLLGIVHGGKKGNGELDPIAEFKVNFFIFTEVFLSTPETSVIGSAALPGTLDLIDEVYDAVDALGALGVEGVIGSGRSSDYPEAEIAVFEESKRIVLRQQVSAWLSFNIE
ncbi:MAG: hypothetical protein A3J97_10690 [Spirochaetes bacterium RIFOXYC1_FULL_54_7]|nr:MAG: hypothetical protein A3J97_10690 [Spirochaetes bacterium RIFOXYC1_FULL_54_7]